MLPPWLHVRAELRERMEGFDGAGFDAAREDLYWLHRLRLNAALTTSPHLAFQAQIQDANVTNASRSSIATPRRALREGRLCFRFFFGPPRRLERIVASCEI